MQEDPLPAVRTLSLSRGARPGAVPGQGGDGTHSNTLFTLLFRFGRDHIKLTYRLNNLLNYRTLTSLFGLGYQTSLINVQHLELH